MRPLGRWIILAPFWLIVLECWLQIFNQLSASCKWENMKKGKTWIKKGGGGLTYTDFDSEYIEAIYTPKRNVDISTAMELWLF